MGDEREISMSLPLDSDGFLRRECPTCERQFKWLPSEEQLTKPDERGYYCPYCGVQASIDSWWTKSQLKYAEKLVVSELVAPELEGLQNSLLHMAHRSGGVLKFEPGRISRDQPDLLVEPDDMKRVDFTCHPSEPVKVLEDWSNAVHCLICGRANDQVE